MSNEKIKINSNYLRGDLAQDLQNTITGAISEDNQQLIKFHGIYQQDDRDRRAVRALKKLEKDFSFMIRLRIAGGKILAKQWQGVAEIAAQNSTNVIKITTRQTIQLHGVIKSTLKPTVKWFDRFGLDAIAACGDVNRNVMSSAIVEKSKAEAEVFDFAKAISDQFLPQTGAFKEIWLDEEKVVEEGVEEESELYGKTYLPRKFKIVLATPPFNDVDVYAHDIGLIAIIKNDKLEGFNVTIGGGMGTTHGNEKTYPRLGNLIGFVARENAIKVARTIITIQRDHGNREDRKLSRLKYTVDRLGLDWFVSEIEKRSEIKLEKAAEFKFTNRNDEYGWAKDYQGLWHHTLFVENGRILDNYLDAINEITKQELSNLRFTNNQNVILSEVKESDKSKVDAILKKYELNNNQSPLRQSAMACVALNTCPLALAEGQRYLPQLITKVEKLVAKHNLNDAEISMRMTGCPNGCARPFLAEIGFVGKALGKYNMYLGASPVGSRLNTLYKEAIEEPEILHELDGLFALYAKEKEQNELFGDFVTRKKIV